MAWAWGDNALVIDGRRLECACFGPPPGEAPTLVLLHEGLGCARALARLPAKTAGGDRLRRVRLFALRLRRLRHGPSAAPARLHDARGGRRAAKNSRRHRFYARRACRAQRRRDDRGDPRRLRRRLPGARPRADGAACLHRTRRPRLDPRGARRLRAGRSEAQAGALSPRRRRRIPRLVQAPGSIPASKAGTSPTSSTTGACRRW